MLVKGLTGPSNQHWWPQLLLISLTIQNTGHCLSIQNIPRALLFYCQVQYTQPTTKLPTPECHPEDSHTIAALHKVSLVIEKAQLFCVHAHATLQVPMAENVDSTIET